MKKKEHVFPRGQTDIFRWRTEESTEELWRVIPYGCQVSHWATPNRNFVIGKNHASNYPWHPILNPQDIWIDVTGFPKSAWWDVISCLLLQAYHMRTLISSMSVFLCLCPLINIVEGRDICMAWKCGGPMDKVKQVQIPGMGEIYLNFILRFCINIKTYKDNWNYCMICI